VKVKDIVIKVRNLSEEKAKNLIVLRSGGWLEDQINPAEWPGGIKAPKFEEHNPEFSLKPTKGYIEYCFSDDKDRQRLDFDVRDIS
jgi:hypothetical protein